MALAFTSPPYNVGKDYDHDMSLDDYLELIERVAAEVYRVLRPGGRYVVNIANLGRKPYIPLHAHFYTCTWRPASCPWARSSGRRAKGPTAAAPGELAERHGSPRLRDVHEYLLVFAKEAYSRPDRGESDISRRRVHGGHALGLGYSARIRHARRPSGALSRGTGERA